MTLQPGQTVGRYQILEPLGVGGMATVYKAYQPSLEREIALKVLRPGFADDAEFFQRFQREARSIAKLRHPNIVQVFDFEPLDGRYVLAMEFLEGGTLKDRAAALALEGKRFSAAQISRVVSEVADALTYAHELGVVHRDVKPSNVMLAGRDRAVVTDFGIAKIVGGEGQTQTGVGIGTPEYMAPEQGTGTAVDHRADIYSLGVMAYELLTGRVPFVADTPLAVVLAHIRDPLPLPSSVEPSVDAQTERVLLKALAKNPDDRYASATDFADALKAALVPVQPTAETMYPIATPLSPASEGQVAGRGLPRIALIGGALVALALVAGAAFAFARGGVAAPGETASPAPSVQAVPLRGPLLYEAKLDAAGSEVNTQLGPPGSQPAPSGRTLDGAIEFVVTDPQTPMVMNWRRKFPATFFAELDVQATPGATFTLSWELWRTPQSQTPQARMFLSTRPNDELAEVSYALNEPGQFVTPEFVTSGLRFPGLASGDKATIGVAVGAEGRFSVFFNGEPAGSATEPRAAAAGGEHLLSIDVHGGVGTLTVTGLRVYELATP